MQVKGFIIRYLHLLLFATLGLIYTYELSRVRHTYNRIDKVINEDAFGYYIILPAVFKYHDPEFAFIDTVLRKTETYKNYTPPVINTIENGERVCKYYSGVALLQAPFYLVAKVLAERRGNFNGFEHPFHTAIMWSAAFYVLLGLFRLMRTGIKIGLHPALSALLPALPLFGSNFFIYASYDIAYSHAYSFFALACLTESFIDIKHKPGFKSIFRSGLFYGLVVCIRPFNGIALLFVPVVFSLGFLKALGVKKSARYAAVFFMGAGILLAVQSLLWHWQTGQWYVYPYIGEQLNLKSPALFEFVFGFNCGWAIYAPLPFAMLLIALASLALSGNFRKFVWAGFASISILYLLSCWYFLHYGCTAGCRPVTEFYAPLLILFMGAIKPWMHVKPYSFLIAIILGILFWYGRILQYQFLENIINWCDMDKRRYKLVFLKTHDAYRYGTSRFWNYDQAKNEDTFQYIPLNKTLSITPEQSEDTFSISMPELDTRDSTILFSILIEPSDNSKPGEVFIRLFLTDAGAYVDLHHVLMSRLYGNEPVKSQYEYDFTIKRPLSSGLLQMSLSTAGRKQPYELTIRGIALRRVLL